MSHVTRILCILALALPLAAQVKITRQGNSKIAVEIDGKPFTDFYIGNENGARKPYLHPLRSASGKTVTRAYPMVADAPNESHDHPHHRGLWFAHSKVSGVSFWDCDGTPVPPTAGSIALAKVNVLTSGKKQGAIDATFHWNKPNGKPLLTESRKMIFYAEPSTRTIDFDIALRAEETAVFADSKEGTFAIRLAENLSEPEPKSKRVPHGAKRTGLMVNAEGGRGEAQVWGKRSPWVDYAGELLGEKLGVAIFDHPGNPRYPTWWHSRSYGLFAVNMFGLHNFEPGSGKDGSLTLEPGKTLRLRYRVLIHSGDAVQAQLAEAYRRYAGK
jgi:hypothetical protein